MIINFDNKSLEDLKVKDGNKLFCIRTFGCPLV